MNILIRNATKADVNSILEILNYEIVNTTSVYDLKEKTIEQQIDWFEKKKSTNKPVLVAEKDGEICGYGSYDTFRSFEGFKYCVEHSIYVQKNHQGEGLGKQLMKELISIANSQSIKSMIAGIDGSNQGSVDFHENFGFEKVGEIKKAGYKFNKWLDLLFMQKMLNNDN